MPNTRLSGRYAYTIIPDKGTMEKAKEISRRYSPDTPATFHVTLYGCLFREANLAFMNHVLRIIREDLYRKELVFSEVVALGRAVNWNLRLPTHDILSAHHACLGFYIYRERTDGLLQEFDGIEFSEAESQNIQEYGHPFVGPQYRPHICLARTASPAIYPGSEELHIGFVENVHLVRLGPWDRIEEIISISNPAQRDLVAEI